MLGCRTDEHEIGRDMAERLYFCFVEVVPLLMVDFVVMMIWKMVCCYRLTSMYPDEAKS